jgi:hypothetical protein
MLYCALALVPSSTTHLPAAAQGRIQLLRDLPNMQIMDLAQYLGLAQQWASSN